LAFLGYEYKLDRLWRTIGVFRGSRSGFPYGNVTSTWAVAFPAATATGLASVAIGYNALASGSDSVAIGNQLSVSSYDCVAVGQYNLAQTGQNSTAWVSTDNLFVVGNGTASNATANAFVISKNGNITMSKRQGDIIMGSFGNGGGD
jgi:hypothetical protein